MEGHMMKRLHYLLTGVAAVLSVGVACAAEYVWDGVDGAWEDAHWNGGQIAPDSPNSKNEETSLDYVNDTFIINSGHVTVSHRLTFAGCTLQVNGGTLEVNSPKNTAVKVGADSSGSGVNGDQTPSILEFRDHAVVIARRLSGSGAFTCVEGSVDLYDEASLTLYLGENDFGDLRVYDGCPFTMHDQSRLEASYIRLYGAGAIFVFEGGTIILHDSNALRSNRSWADQTFDWIGEPGAGQLTQLDNSDVSSALAAKVCRGIFSIDGQPVDPGSTYDLTYDGTNLEWINDALMALSVNGKYLHIEEDPETGAQTLRLEQLPENPPPAVVAGSLTATTLQIQIQDIASTQVDPSTVEVKLDGASIPAQINKQGDTTTITYDIFTATGTPLASDSTHQIEISLQTTQGTEYTVQRSLTVQPYLTIPEAFARSDVDTSMQGFRIRAYQIEGSHPNTIAFTEEMLAGLHGPNIAGDIGVNAEGYLTWMDVLDFGYDNKTGATSVGNFDTGYDFMLVNLPGPTATSLNSSALEVLAFVEFPHAGLYTMGINSDDGFCLQTGLNPKDRFGIVVGQYDGGRSAADSIFTIFVPKPGIYPFRLIWWNGTGSAGIEWFTVQEDGTKVLLNDPTNPDALKVYPTAASEPPYVSMVSPAPGASRVRNDCSISLELASGSTGVDLSSIQLWVNSEQVQPQIQSQAGKVTVKYTPDTLWPSEATIEAQFVWKANGADTALTNQWSFTTMRYVELPTDLVSPLDSVHTDEPGFLVRFYRVEKKDNHTPDNLEFGETVLAGLVAPNIADIQPPTPDGYFVETNVINYARTAPNDNGYFPDDIHFPGIANNGEPNFTVEIRTYVVFPEPGLYLMGVVTPNVWRLTIAEGIQRYLLQVESPTEIAGPVPAVPTINGVNGEFGGPIPEDPLVAPVVYVGGTGCDSNAFANLDLKGKVALIDRGDCSFVEQCLNAQNAGAVAVIIADNETNAFPIIMGGTAPEITIPVMMISYQDGQRLKEHLDGLQVSIGKDPAFVVSEVNKDVPGNVNYEYRFGVLVPEAGVYPFRILIHEDGGYASFEWWTVNEDDSLSLLNDPNDPNALRCYRSREWTPPQKPTISISLEQGQVKIEFTGKLQKAPTVFGPWEEIPGATSPYVISPTEQMQFYRSVSP